MDGPSNVSLVHGDTTLGLPEYKVVSVLLVLLVCTVGIVGNAMVVLVVLTSRDMHTPTNCYLVSLALADLIVLLAAGLPNVSDSLVGHWIYGHAGCLGITYFQYLGINVSSCSILAFTVERYIAICHPMRAQTVCTVARARRIIAGIWGVTSLYCLLWFFLVDLNVRDNQRLECGYKVSRGLYLPIYLLDFAVFFIAPLLGTLVLYGFIGRILFQSPLSQEAWQKERQSHGQSEGTPGNCSRSKSSMSSRKQSTVPLKHSTFTNMAVPHLLGVCSSHCLVSRDRLTMAWALDKPVHNADSRGMGPTGSQQELGPQFLKKLKRG